MNWALHRQGIAQHPDDARMYRFRGHRYISVRDFDRARIDLERAAELAANRADEAEPSGKPNERGVVHETLKLNIYYHLALAHYLQGDFDGALPMWRECLRYATNPDTLCMATYWLSMTLARFPTESYAAVHIARSVPAALRASMTVLFPAESYANEIVEPEASVLLVSRLRTSYCNVVVSV